MKMIGSAYECSEKFDKDGKLRERRRSVGGITLVCVVALFAVVLNRDSAWAVVLAAALKGAQAVVEQVKRE